MHSWYYSTNRLHTAPSKLITIHNLHKTYISLSHDVCVAQVYHRPLVAGMVSRVGTTWSHQVPGRPTLLKRHQPPSLEDSTRSTKNSYSSKICTKFDTLSLDIFHNIDRWDLSFVYHKKKLMWLTQKNPLLRSTSSYKLKYLPLDYHMYYEDISYV